MKIICEHPTCDNEIIYKHKFQDQSFSVENWYEGNYCAAHMIEHLEHCINIIRLKPEETP